MVDFTSTQVGIDAESQRSARLLAAVLAQALKDLTIPPTGQEKKQRLNINRDAYESLRFFYEPESPFKRYAYLVGLDPKAFIQNLELRMLSRGVGVGKNTSLSHCDVRIMRIRSIWYKNQRAIQKAREKEDARP
jgi:hypothetical protein